MSGLSLADIFVHVFGKHIERYVATVYLFGRDETATPELATWFARKMSERMRPPEPEPTPEGE